MFLDIINAFFLTLLFILAGVSCCTVFVLETLVLIYLDK